MKYNGSGKINLTINNYAKSKGNFKEMTNKEITLQNFIILRDGWEKQDFHPYMPRYSGIDSRYVSKLKLGQVNECGTNCCALGKAPEFKGLEIQEEDIVQGRFCYYKYSKRVFPSLNFEIYLGGWDFLFSSKWPNNKFLLLSRLNYVIENNLQYPPSEEWESLGYNARMFLEQSRW